MRRKREIRYVKPSLVFNGRLGREIIQEIRNTPPQDLTPLLEGAKGCERKLKELEKRGIPI